MGWIIQILSLVIVLHAIFLHIVLNLSFVHEHIGVANFYCRTRSVICDDRSFDDVDRQIQYFKYLICLIGQIIGFVELARRRKFKNFLGVLPGLSLVIAVYLIADRGVFQPAIRDYAWRILQQDEDYRRQNAEVDDTKKASRVFHCATGDDVFYIGPLAPRPVKADWWSREDNEEIGDYLYARLVLVYGKSKERNFSFVFDQDTHHIEIKNFDPAARSVIETCKNAEQGRFMDFIDEQNRLLDQSRRDVDAARIKYGP